MIGYVIFDSSDNVLLLSNSLRFRLGFDLDDSSSSLTLQELIVGDWNRFRPSDKKVLKRAGRVRCQNGDELEAMFSVQRISENVEQFVMDIELLEEDAKIEDKTEKSGIDPSSLVFLTTVSHELRVSLNGVIGFANLLGGSGLNSEQGEILEKMQSCNFVLKGLINDILEYSRVTSANVDLNTESVPLADFIREVVGLFNERARKKGIELRLDVKNDIPARVKLPKLRVTQILSNLISNAIKFTESGWVSVSAAVVDPFLRFTVTDSGSGILENDKDRIFQPFVQSSPPEIGLEGSGLGLAISRSLAERMNGSLYLETPSSGGSAFNFDLPLALGDETEKVGVEDQGGVFTAVDSQLKSDSEGRRVLIVEDNKLNADILSHFLREYGVDFDIVDNGRSAVEVYEDGKYDLILMDVMLPEMNGYEATERILANSKRADTLPIIGVTAKVFRRDQMRCLEAGMVEVVHKPVDFNALGVALDKYLYGEIKGEVKNEPHQKVVSEDASFESSAAAATEDSSLDEGVLAEYISRMTTETRSGREVLNTALTIIDEEISSLLVALGKGSKEEVSLRSHSLKGALALLGSRDLLDLAKGLELVSSQSDEPLRTEHWKGLIELGYQSFRSAVMDYYAQVK